MTLPVDVEGIARQLGLKIESAPLGYSDSSLDADNQTIYVNESASELRRRSAIAQEIGHYVLGHGSSLKGGESMADYFQNPRNAAAYFANALAANRFAAELLMPAEAVKIVFDRLHITKSERLREMLGVSALALNYRLRELGYID